jgi:hypothetical protein
MHPRGVGDRWLAGETIAGVAFAHHQAVTVAGGAHDGADGIVLLLMAVTPEPRYLVRLATDGREVRLRQGELGPAR